MTERVGIKGLVIVEHRALIGSKGLVLVHRQELENLVTQAGDQAYGDALAGLNANATVTDPSPPVAMQLGTGVTAAAKTGAGAAIVTYISGSNQVFPVSYPQSSLNGASRRISYQAIWIAGDSTNAAIAEAVIATISTDGAASAAQTYSRVVFGSTIDKQAGDTLTVTWHHDLLGA